MATEGVTKLVGPLPNQKMILSTVRADTRGITRGDPDLGTEDLETEYRPIRGDYPEVMLQHLGGRLTTTGPTYTNGAPIPEKTPRPVNYRRLPNHFGYVSARSKRELRAIIAAANGGAGAKIVHNIQVRDDGRYFVYADESIVAPTVAADCVEETPQKLSDITPGSEEC